MWKATVELGDWDRKEETGEKEMKTKWLKQ
jgi:hypothetical protein